MTLLRQNDKINTWKKQQTCNKVYEAIYYLTGSESIERRKVSVKEIRTFFQEQIRKENEEFEKIANQKYENGELDLKEKEEYISKRKKKAPSQKTIERCLKDPRIVEDGAKYFISDRKRFESEFGVIDYDPHEFGLAIHDAILGGSRRIPLNERSNSYYNEELKDFVVKIGCFFIFAMIEAAKPIRYKTLAPKEGEDLVYYWLKNVMPYKEIFYAFRFKFDEPKQSHDWKTPISEIRQPIIDSMMHAMESFYPDICNRYILAKEKVLGKNIQNIE